jgi:predicted amidophosphoribosyltransferase
MKCRDCPADAAPNRVSCPQCLAKAAIRRHKSATAKRLAGICLDCQSPVALNRVFCSSHLAAFTAKRRANKIASLRS